jgi:preprotein translocase subunit SecF
MIQILKDVKVDWLGNRRIFIAISVLLMLAGLSSAVIRQFTGGHPFNLGVDFKGGTVATVKFKQRPGEDAIRSALSSQGVRDAVVQATDKADVVLIKLALEGQSQSEIKEGGVLVRKALDTFGPEAKPELHLEGDPSAAYEVIGTEAVGAIAGAQLRNKAIAVTLLALVGILLFISARYEWTYGAAAVIAVFHDVLVTLAFFSIFQWEVSLTVIAALLTLVGFSVNDTIVIFDRIRENRRIKRRETLYELTNEAINQTLSRTVITGGLVFLSVLAMVLFGGEGLRGFSLALLIGVIVGTYSTVAIASPIMVWWEKKIEAANRAAALSLNKPVRGGVVSQSKTSSNADSLAAHGGKRSRGASRV